jgi:hypothetical protein
MAEFTDITFRVNTAHLPRMIEAHAARFGYRETDIDGLPNTEPKAAYVKRKIWMQWVRTTLDYEISQMPKPDPIEGGEV